VYPPRSRNHAGLAAFRDWLLQEAHAYAGAEAQAAVAAAPRARRARKR
jgi:LysR family glycine cleavage system transcriptional activator